MLGIVRADGGPWTRMDTTSASVRSAHTASPKSRANGKLHHFASQRGPRQLNHSRLDEAKDARGSPVSTVVNIMNETPATNPNDVIEVQILPQDNWADNTTAVTGNTSECSTSVQDEYGRFQMAPEQTMDFRCRRHVSNAVAVVVCVFAFLTPVAMVILPNTRVLGLKKSQLECGAECDGTLISLAFKLLVLAAGTWAVFMRPSRATLPRINTFRAIVLTLTFTFTFSYWLFFMVRVLEERAEMTYYTILLFAGSLVDALLWLHVLAVLLLELRQLQPQYAVRVVRSPDGEARLFPIGRLSIQRTAAVVLEKYYTEFPVYNPFLERLPSSKGSRKTSSVTSYKFYDVDGSTNGSALQSPTRIPPASRRKDASHNERFYEEYEYERRVKKRRSRLVTAAEEAFTHIKRLKDEQGPAVPMDPHEAAQAIFPTMARPLQKFLRITRQQPRHTMESILAHLAQCLAHDLAPRAFLERYVASTPVLMAEREGRTVKSWSLVCDTLLSRPLSEGVVFQLRQNDVSLLCSVSALPHFNLSEEIIDPKSNKFVLRLNSETSV